MVRIAENVLVAGKVVPAAPARRRGPAAHYAELARVAARAWQPVESERLGDWELRAAYEEAPGAASAETPGAASAETPGAASAEASGAGRPWRRRAGFTRRANSVLPLGDPGRPLDDALARVRRWYAERGLPAYVQTATGAEGTQELLCAGLVERGWQREVSAELRVGGLAPVGDLDADTGRVLLSRNVDDAWLGRYQRTGVPGPRARQVLAAGPSVWFAAVPAADGPPAAIGRCVVDGRWAGFMAVEVDPARRREGLATAVMTALARRALDEGASAAWLQVEEDNGGARALYDGMGFAVHHSYHHYREPDDNGGG